MVEVIPIFVIIHDRLECTKRCIAAIENAQFPTEIILFNHNSTFPPLIEYLNEKEKEGYLVFNIEDLKATTRGEILVSRDKNLAKCVSQYLEKHPEAKYYAITDCDIELAQDDENERFGKEMFEFYISLLEADLTTSVGPALRIDDLPDHYPKKKTVIRYEKKYWQKYESVSWAGNEVKLYDAPIDTTFKLMHRSNIPSSNHWNRSARRVGAPYWARHLDWYLDPKNLSKDQIYYMENPTVSHWQVK